MDKVRTVSDTKRDFYTYHTRPINSVYRRVVEELMVEMHLLSVNVDFCPEPIYYLGVVTSFDRFMQGYKPTSDLESIFSALCKSIGGEPQVYRQQADALLSLAKSLSVPDLISWLSNPTAPEGLSFDWQAIAAIANDSKLKYSRLLAIGLYTLLEGADFELVDNESKRTEVLEQLSATLNLPEEKLQKDLELYRSNLEKMAQLLTVLEEALEADRKKREQ